MTLRPQLHPFRPSDLGVIENLWQCYQHDLSAFRGSLPDRDGRYKSSRVAAYFGSPDRAGYVIRIDDAPVGFAMIRGLVEPPRIVGEFFVVRALRRQGVGRAAATDVIRRHPGRWELAFQEENQRASRFWRNIATGFSGSAWTVTPRARPGRPQSPPDLWLAFDA